MFKGLLLVRKSARRDVVDTRVRRSLAELLDGPRCLLKDRRPEVMFNVARVGREAGIRVQMHIGLANVIAAVPALLRGLGGGELWLDDWSNGVGPERAKVSLQARGKLQGDSVPPGCTPPRDLSGSWLGGQRPLR